MLSAWRIVSEDSSFALVFPADYLHRTDCHFLRSTVGYSDVPAFSQVLLRQQFHLRTVIVTAAIHWGFDSQLRACALTAPLNLPALGRRQPPYVVFTTLRRPVFLVNSRLGHFSATSPLRGGYPSPEVTGTFCRVPEREFSQAP